MWYEQFSQALEDNGLSAFARQVLSDYQVTQAEYQESFDRFSKCVADAGYVLEGQPGGYSVGLPQGRAVTNDAMKAMTDAVNACEGPDSDSAWITISGIYEGMANDPEGLTPAQIVRECYQAHDVPDGAGLSDDQFSQMIDSPDYTPSSPDALLCYWDPTGSLGWTVDQAEQAQAGKNQVTQSYGPTPVYTD